ncbi:hypothetical protein P5G50_05130 [Leifsonia sp. F6_8S_P_1B]|uniref:Uncharacterized protein n=1 Tax=Leifsonia williamsii TaxID=3035919 RepID=A0ABT8K8N3_9MICO|nr:hypothetical protein [Leifsonia williamsii]MDN4613830.1 hypothetical protein [Leifsonia williamsii]
MDPHDLAAGLLDRAVADQQASHRVGAGIDVPAVRAEVRRLARERGVRIRTGIVGDALVVVRADADLWHEPVAVMREKLEPGEPGEPGEPV